MFIKLLPKINFLPIFLTIRLKNLPEIRQCPHYIVNHYGSIIIWYFHPSYSKLYDQKLPLDSSISFTLLLAKMGGEHRKNHFERPEMAF